MEYLKQFKKHAKDNNLPSAVSLWQEYCLSDEVDPKEMILILKEIKQAEFLPSFGVYVEDGLELWDALIESSEKSEILKLIFDIQTTNNTKYREVALKYLTEKYGMIDIYNELLRIVGLRDGEDFQGCIGNFQLLIHLQKGNFCFHTGSWGVGEVMDISFLRREISVEFDLVSDIKEISFKNAFKILTPLSADHFLARRFGDPEKFEQYTRANPIDAIKLLLKDLGDMTAFEIKEEMADLVIPEEEWSKWWSSVRSKLKKDTEIIYPSSIKLPFKLTRKKITHQDRLKALLSEERKVSKLIEVLYVFFRDFSSLTKEAEFNTYLRREIADIMLNKNISEAEELQLLFLLEDLHDNSQGNISEIIKKCSAINSLVSDIEILSYKRRLLSEVKKNRDDWSEIFCNLVISQQKHNLRDFLYEELIESKKQEQFKGKIEEVIKHPQSSPQAFLWLFQKIMKKKIDLFSAQKDLNKLFESFFVLMHYVEVTLKDRVIAKKMYSMLSESRFEIVRRIFKGAGVDTIKEILLLSTKCQILTSHDSKILYSLAEVVHPELGKLQKGATNEEERIIWTTAEGFKKATDRIEQIATKETVENAKEIEIARAHGDLRENSEYKFAMEKRARLQSEMKTLSRQVKNMRVLTPEDVDLSKVSVGTKVTIKSEKETIIYKILGPFDADPEKNILSAQSRLALQLLNKSIGEKVEIGDNTWNIEEISSAL